ncbi:MAG: OpgC family protein [Alphaproteobacteria bacterium]
MQRDLRLDFFRGLSLIFIFIDHIPYNVLSYFTLQSNTFFDAAEVFIFISGYTAALVYGRRLAAKGAIYATAQVWRRAWTLYVAHIFLFVLFIAQVSYTAATFNNPMYNEEMRVADFLDEPHVAIVQALLLRFQPAFLDILPMYIVLLVIFPAVLLGLRLHWLPVLALSAALYAAVQILGISFTAYPAGYWYFNPLAWQFLFVSGAVLAHLNAEGYDLTRLLRTVFPVAALIFGTALIVRVSWTLHSLWDAVPVLLLKPLWPAPKDSLSPVRLIPFFALVVLVAVLIRPHARFLASRAARPLVIAGQQSLEIFCLGILLSALAHVLINELGYGLGLRLAVNALGIAIMLITAKVLDWYKALDRMPAQRPAAAPVGRAAQ